MKKITITLYSPKELWRKFWNRFFWPRRKQCSEWMDIFEVDLHKAIVLDIIESENYIKMKGEMAENLEKDITIAILKECEKFRKVICKPYEEAN